MAERNKRKVDQLSKELTPKELRLRERHRNTIAALHLRWSCARLALLLILAGAIHILRSTQHIASVGDRAPRRVTPEPNALAKLLRGSWHSYRQWNSSLAIRLLPARSTRHSRP